MGIFLLSGLTQPVSFELQQGFNTVGRNPTNDVRLRDATVSSFHCEIVLKQDDVLIRDLGSSNGTFVNGRAVQECRLPPGSILRLGSFELKLDRRAEEEAEAVRITVPKSAAEEPAVAPALADGLPACARHTGIHAAFECTRCRKRFCSECVRVLGLSGNARAFCPQCSGICEALAVPPGITTVPAKKPSSILARLTQTIHIRPPR
jgi:predicted component of type VI protein secretion system